MSDENDRSVASTGSVDEPAAWEVYWAGAARQPYLVSASEKPSDGWTPAPHCVPLYRQPQSSLTDAEREAVEGAIEAEHRRGAWQWAATLRGLLERTDPRLAAIERLAELEQELRIPDETA